MGKTGLSSLHLRLVKRPSQEDFACDCSEARALEPCAPNEILIHLGQGRREGFGGSPGVLLDTSYSTSQCETILTVDGGFDC